MRDAAREGRKVGDYKSIRIKRARWRELKKAIRENPTFKGPPKWTLTDVLDHIVSEFVRNGGSRGRAQK